MVDGEASDEIGKGQRVGDREFEVGQLASRHGLSLDQARQLVDTHGIDWEILDREAAAISNWRNGMNGDREDRIRVRAHQIWEEAGRPEGLDRQHWEQA